MNCIIVEGADPESEIILENKSLIYKLYVQYFSQKRVPYIYTMTASGVQHFEKMQI